MISIGIRHFSYYLKLYSLFSLLLSFSINGFAEKGSLYTEKDYLNVFWRSLFSAEFIAPSEQQLVDAEKLFSELLDQPEGFKYLNYSDKELSNSFFNTKIVKNDDELLLLIHEKNTPYSGAGFYIIRPQKRGNGVLLQAPHGFSDLKTGALALQLMKEYNFSALAVNTARRHYTINQQVVDADLAHFSDSFFLRFSRSFAQKYSKGQILQLHGFNSTKRQVTSNVSMIVSAGTKRYPVAMLPVVECLKSNVSLTSKAFPAEIAVLGGTQNTIGKTMREMGFNGFRHVEINLDLRRKLISDQSLRHDFVRCFINNDKQVRK